MTGCVIQDPPPYTQPEQTPPRLHLYDAIPSYDATITLTANGRMKVDVPVTSEDAGDSLVAFLIRNYDGRGFFPVATADIAPGTLDDPPDSRVISIEWVIGDTDPGCHMLTLLVTHQSNLSFEGQFNVVDTNDIAVTAWRVELVPQPGSNGPLAECPKTSGTAQ